MPTITRRLAVLAPLAGALASLAPAAPASAAVCYYATATGVAHSTCRPTDSTLVRFGCAGVLVDGPWLLAYAADAAIVSQSGYVTLTCTYTTNAGSDSVTVSATPGVPDATAGILPRGTDRGTVCAQATYDVGFGATTTAPFCRSL